MKLKAEASSETSVAIQSPRLKDAFRIRDAEKLNGKRVLLVDDVYTTGATADECSKVLLGAGARRVYVLTLARAM